MGFENNIKSIVFSMAFPGPRNGRSTQLGKAPEKYMLQSVQFIIKTKFFNGIEVTIVKDPVIRHKLAEMYKENDLFVTFSAQPVQLVNEDHLIDPGDISCIDEVERCNAVERMKELIDEAYEIGAKQFCFLSGQDPGSEDGLRKRKLALRSLTMSIKEMCLYNCQVAKEYKRDPINDLGIVRSDKREKYEKPINWTILRCPGISRRNKNRWEIFRIRFTLRPFTYVLNIRWL